MNVGLPENPAAWEPARDPVKVRRELDLLTDLELAQAFCVTTQTLATWRRKKYGPPAISIGKGVFYRQWDVLRWVCSQKQEGPNDNQTSELPGHPGNNPWSWSPGPIEARRGTDGRPERPEEAPD